MLLLLLVPRVGERIRLVQRDTLNTNMSGDFFFARHLIIRYLAVVVLTTAFRGRSYCITWRRDLPG